MKEEMKIKFYLKEIVFQTLFYFNSLDSSSICTPSPPLLPTPARMGRGWSGKKV
jgi:hypothetical protein